MLHPVFLKSLKFSLLAGASLLAGGAILQACSPLQAEMREVTAERIARPAFMVERRLSAGPMDFQLWERMHAPGAPANVYIEGDGKISAKGGMFTDDPTPTNPVALHLASRDKADNLLYLGRPCQFRESQNEDSCAKQYWQGRRFSPEVIKAYSDILDEVKDRYGITAFNLIGYDGGANIAAAIASQRNDIISMRTVAGILNPPMVYNLKEHPIHVDSVQAQNLASQLANLPQHHFVGAGDEHVPAGVYHSYRQAMGASECTHYTFVQDADHERGWVEKWPELLKLTISCPYAQAPAGYAPTDTLSEAVLPQSYVPPPLPPVPNHIDRTPGVK